MTAFIIIAALVGIAIGAFLISRKQNTQSSGSTGQPTVWSAGPVIDGKNYSPGVVTDANGSFTFPQLPGSVHYVTKDTGPIKGSGIRLRYRIDVDPNVKFYPSSDPSAETDGPVLYFQREGDDWSGVGQFEAYRWWATFDAPVPIVAGEHELVALFNQRWTAVETSNSESDAAAFQAALNNAKKVGFVFGGGTGYGHGVYVDGHATFTVLDFEIIP